MSLVRYTSAVDCRPGCGACCIAPSISSAIPGMPDGKPPGVRCVNLDDASRCRIWGRPEYPAVCRLFPAMEDTCGASTEEALRLLTRLEHSTAPSRPPKIP